MLVSQLLFPLSVLALVIITLVVIRSKEESKR